MAGHSNIQRSMTNGRRRFDNGPTARRATGVIVVSLLIGLSGPGRAQEPQPARSYGPEAPPSAAEVQALREELRRQAELNQKQNAAQQQAIDRLAAKLAEEQAARLADESALRQSTDEARRATGDAPLVRSGRLQLTLSGFVQMDVTAWNQASQDELNQSTAQPLNQTQFQLRRARLRAEVNYRAVGGAVEFDGNTVNGYQARIIGAEASLYWRNPNPALVPYLQLTAGSFKIPYGFEIEQRDTERLFIDRSTMERAMFPGEYDLGARLRGGWRFLRYSIAAMNGDPIGEKLFPGRDPNQSKDVIGRIGIDARIIEKLALAGGFSALWGTGFHKGTPDTKAVLAWRDVNQDGAVELNELSNIPGTSATPSSTFSRWAVGGDLRLAFGLPVVGELMLYGELTYATNLDRALYIADPVSTQRDLRELGYYAAITQELTPWAQVGVRYDYYNPDRDANQLRYGVQAVKDPSYSTLAVTAAGRYPGYGRLIAEYQHNTNALGRTDSGLVTTLKSDAFILRAEVKF
jgi:hypothetical protein